MKKQKNVPDKPFIKNMPMPETQRRPVKRAALFHRKGNRHS